MMHRSMNSDCALMRIKRTEVAEHVAAADLGSPMDTAEGHPPSPLRQPGTLFFESTGIVN